MIIPKTKTTNKYILRNLQSLFVLSLITTIIISISLSSIQNELHEIKENQELIKKQIKLTEFNIYKSYLEQQNYYDN